MITPERQRILDVMTGIDETYTPAQVTDLTGLPYDSVRLIMRKMERNRLLVRVKYGQYVRAEVKGANQ